MTEIQNIREYIVSECSDKEKPTLADIISSFDMHQHAIPNLEEIKSALKGIDSIAVSRKGNEIIFAQGNPKSNIEITENDLSKAYEHYTENLK